MAAHQLIFTNPRGKQAALKFPPGALFQFSPLSLVKNPWPPHHWPLSTLFWSHFVCCHSASERRSHACATFTGWAHYAD